MRFRKQTAASGQRSSKEIQKDLKLARLGLARVRGARRTGYQEEIAGLQQELAESKGGRL